MSTNKHALIRYRVIDKCLRQLDNQWNWKSLAEACSKEIEKITGKKTTLSERTIKGDIQNMRNDSVLGYFAPIEYDRSEKSYYYSRRDFSITEAPLSRSDSKELQQAIGLLRQFTGFRHLEGMENIIQKLELLAYESRTESKKIVHIEQAPVIPGQVWLDQLYEAIKNEETLFIRYKPFDREPSSFIISPYLLKEFGHRWYLYAHNHERNQLRTYGLERIESVQSSFKPHIATEDFDPEIYFNDIIGVTLDPTKNISRVQFEVKGNTVSYIRTKPIHKTQKEIESIGKNAVFEIEVIPNFELESELLSFGEAIRVLKPKSLARSIQKRIDKMLRNYET
ncbi:MAG: WYL domain-containing protein [Saprospiraceae bacterium]|nr:WYL domain-containing protein [Saprospiraceae bacterium]